MSHDVLKDPSPSSSDLFCLTNQMRHSNLDVQSKKPVCNDAKELCQDDMAKQVAWEEHHDRLSNVEFNRDLDSLTEDHTVEGHLHSPTPAWADDQVHRADEMW